MRRVRVLFAVILVVLAGTAIGIGAYNAGVSHGLAQAGHATQIVRVVGPGFGWFPFGFLLFPLFFFVLFGLVLRPLLWGRRWDGRRHGDHGPGWAGPEGRLHEWHARQHEREAGVPGPGGDSATV